jgi:phosphoglycolate phosphatase-like HAD superfamily hydrolase
MGLALKEVFGSDGPIDQYPMSGKTDQQIMRELMLLNGIGVDKINAKLPLACQVYVRIVCESISNFDLLPCIGIPELLKTLQEHKDITLGLLTGNLEGIVEPKLSRAGLRKSIFSIGAYGSDEENRNLLPGIAISRAENLLKRKLDLSSVIIIGDTPLDIECARAAGTRILSVATGHFKFEELAEYKPDYIFNDFGNLPLFMEIIQI